MLAADPPPGAPESSAAAPPLGTPPDGAPAGPEPQAAARDARASDRWRAACFVFAAVAIVAGTAWALLGSSLLVVRSVQVSGTHLVTRAQVMSASGVTRGTPLIRVNTAAVAHRVEQLAPVQSARVSRHWPDKVVITVRERTPALAVHVGGTFWLVDADGVTVRQVPAQPAGMPLLTAPVPTGSSLRGSPAVRSAVGVLHSIPPQLRSRVISLSAPTAGAVTVQLTRKVSVMWGDSSRSTAKAAELSILMHKHLHYFDVSDPDVAVTKK
jgi:cell division protein FtsQ